MGFLGGSAKETMTGSPCAEKSILASTVQTTFLSSGSSDYPVDLLKKSGVDMLQPGPFIKTMRVMNRTMDEIEALLKEKGKKDTK